MVNEEQVKNNFIEYANKKIKELDIPSWYVGYYSEVCDGTYREYMKGARLPRPAALIMMAELFECTVNDLLGYRHTPVPMRKSKFSPGLDVRPLSDYFYSQVARRMIRKRISLDDLSISVGVTPQTLDGYFKNTFLLDTSMILRICDALDCTPSELLGY